MRTLFIFLLFLLFCVGEGYAGKKTMEIPEIYKTTSYPLPDSLLLALINIHKEAEKKPDFKILEETSELLSNHYQLTGDYHEGFSIANNYLKMIVETNDSTLIPAAYYYVGKLYYGLGLPGVSMEYFFAMTHFTLDEAMQCKVFYAIAETLRNLNGDDAFNSMDYYQKSEKIARQLNDSSRIASALFGQSQLYFNSMDAYKKEDMAATKDSLNASTRLLEEALDYKSGYILYLGLALNYAAGGDYEKALEFAEKGMVLCRQIPDVVSVGLNSMAAIQIQMGNYDEAIRIAKESYEYAEKWDKKGDMSNASYMIYYAYKEKSDYVQALNAYETNTLLNNIIRNKERDLKLASMKVQFDTLQKEKQLEYEKKRSRYYIYWIIGISAGLIVILLFFFFYILYYQLYPPESF